MVIILFGLYASPMYTFNTLYRVRVARLIWFHFIALNVFSNSVPTIQISCTRVNQSISDLIILKMHSKFKRIITAKQTCQKISIFIHFHTLGIWSISQQHKPLAKPQLHQAEQHLFAISPPAVQTTESLTTKIIILQKKSNRRCNKRFVPCQTSPGLREGRPMKL